MLLFGFKNKRAHQKLRFPIGSFVFLNYDDSRNFLNKVADLAEEEDHHPELTLEWGKVTVLWWSHKIKGLHKNDFICASKTDSLFKNLQ